MAEPRIKKQSESFASVARVSAFGCLLTSIYIALVAAAEQSHLGSTDANVLVTKTTVSLPLLLDIFSITLSFASPVPTARQLIVLISATAAFFFFAASSAPDFVAASRAVVLVAVAAASPSSKIRKSPRLISLYSLSSWIISILSVLIAIGAFIHYRDDSIMFPMVDPSRSVDPFAINKRVSIYDDTYSLHLNCAGGPKPTEENKKRHFFSPTIVLETGLAMTSTVSWNQTLLIKLRNIGLFLNSEEGFGSDLRVCFYDRAGYGFSDSGPMPQTAKRNAEALYETLKAAEEIGPFILVGHSFGGNIIRIFAHAHSEQVAGIVFLDSDHEDRFERSAALWPAKSLDAYHAEFVNMATKMGAAGALASPFAAGDRLLVDEFSKMQVGHVYTAREIAATFKGKFFKAVSSEMLNYVHTNPPQIRKTVPYAPRTNLPVSVVIAISDITKYCTPKPRVPRDSKQFTNIDAENDTPASMCEPLHETNLAPSLAAAEAQAHFEGQWKLATQLSRVTRVLFVESSHYVVFDAPDAIVEAVEAVVLEARRFARGEFVSWHETTENQEDEELVEMEDDYF